MCCWPYTDLYLEDEEPKKDEKVGWIYDPRTGYKYLTNIPVGPTPIIYQQPTIPHASPIFQPPIPLQVTQPPPIVYPQQQYAQPGYPGYPGYQAPFFIQQPAFGTIGLTGSDVLNQQLATAQNLNMNEKQEMKPADDDKNRMYWVRELDNTWTQRNRVTIDSGDIGDVRWYAVDGAFYAVRLPMD